MKTANTFDGRRSLGACRAVGVGAQFWLEVSAFNVADPGCHAISCTLVADYWQMRNLKVRNTPRTWRILWLVGTYRLQGSNDRRRILVSAEDMIPRRVGILWRVSKGVRYHGKVSISSCSLPERDEICWASKLNAKATTQCQATRGVFEVRSLSPLFHLTSSSSAHHEAL